MRTLTIDSTPAEPVKIPGALPYFGHSIHSQATER